MDVEDGDVAAAGVDAEEEGVVLAKGEGALGFERVGDASAAAAVGVIGDAFAEGAVGGALESDDFVFIGIVRHDKDIAISADGKFVYTINSQSGNIGIFAINQQNGTLTSLGQAGDLPKSVGFNGIAAL